MPVRLMDFVRFLSRVWTPEKLPTLPSARSDGPAPEEAVTLRSLLASDQLPAARPDRPRTADTVTLRSLFAAESLPPPLPARHGTIGLTTLRRLLARADLPLTTGEPAPRARSLVRFILTREKLPSTAEME